MTTAGVDRRTGRPLEGWPHVEQSLEVIFSTRFGERVMRRHFGSAVPGLLGRNLTDETVMRFFVAFAIAVELWEPRFRIRRFSLPAATNGPGKARAGALGIAIHGDYLPGAPDGDMTVVIPKTIVL